jgi:hypothetical protein
MKAAGMIVSTMARCYSRPTSSSGEIIGCHRILLAMDLNEARALAMSLPEVVEQPHFDMASWRIRGKIFATGPADGQFLHIFVDELEAKASVADDPAAFEELWWGKKLSGLRVILHHADAERVFELLEEAWRRKAPKRLAAEYDADAGAATSPS